MKLRNVSLALVLGGLGLAVPAAVTLVRGAEENPPPRATAVRNTRSPEEIADIQMHIAFPNRADIFMIGTDLKIPVASDVQIGEMVETPAGKFLCAYGADRTKYVINPSQIALVRVYKNK